MGTKTGIGIAALVLAIPVLVAGFVSATLSAVLGTGTPEQTGCVLSGPPAHGTSAAVYVPDQIANAATIVAVGKQMHVPEQGWVVAIATTLQESGLRNLGYGDRDSLGLFQQRPSQGWGTPTQIMNPAYAATQFYRHLLAIPGWQRMSVNDAAQAVQASATPDAYGAHQQAALNVLATVADSTCTTDKPGNSTTPAPSRPADAQGQS